MEAATSVIIGAGQAGLAMSRALSARGVDHIVLEKGETANAWRTQRWDSLRLLTPNWANGLPGAPYVGADPDGYMPVSELVGRIDAYARAIDAPVRAGVAARRVCAEAGGYRIETDHGPICCKTVVVATGACARPFTPAMADALPASLPQWTPASYKRPEDLPEGGVLVVGASATGVQLARELRRSGRPVTLAVGAHLRLPRRYRGRDVEWWLEAIGAMDERYDQIEDLERARRAPSPQLIGGPDAVDLNALQDLGVELVGRLMAVRNGAALFSGGLGAHCASADLKMNRLLDSIDVFATARGLDDALAPPERLAPTRTPRAPRLTLDLSSGEIRSVLWATGYRPDYSALQLPVFTKRGRLRHEGGVVLGCDGAPTGIYAIGLPLLRRRRSHQISGVGADARDLADHMRSRLDARRAA